MAENILTKQVAGIPMGAWGVVVAGGLGIAYMLNKNQARSEGAVEPLVEPGVGTGLVPAGAAFVTDSGSTAPTGPENNQAWGVIAKNWLITQGQDPTTADNAVRKYISAENLTIQENALIALVLARFGSPPEDIPPVQVPTTPPPTAPPATGGAPAMSVSSPSHGGRLRKGTRVTFRGRVTIGGKPPASLTDRVVQVTVYYLNKPPGSAIYQRFFLQANSNGDFTGSTGWGTTTAGKRYYQLAWKGIVSNKQVVFY